ncbi:MAG: NHLP leader peptide family RiPP precursor [Deltaproteobacteria bacterium]|nr:NHLP leader peptide family RiPP precursor [Deltaproteobacteria bacterium]
MQVESRGALQDFITNKAANDSQYRDALVANPKSLLAQHLGQELPEWLNVEVVEETANTFYLIAPHVPSDELADEDLEMVAGGKGGGGGNQMDNVTCSDNDGAFNSVVTLNTEVSLV